MWIWCLTKSAVLELETAVNECVAMANLTGATHTDTQRPEACGTLTAPLYPLSPGLQVSVA